MNPIKFIFNLFIWLIFFGSAVELTGTLRALVTETAKVHRRGMISIGLYNRMLVGVAKRVGFSQGSRASVWKSS